MYWRNQLIVLYNTSCRWSNRALKKLDYPHNSNQWRSPEAVVPTVVPKDSIHVHHPKSIVQAIPINRQPVKQFSGQFQLISSLRHHLSGKVQLIESTRQQVFRQFQVIDSLWKHSSGQFHVIDSLRDHLSGKFRLIESTRHQLFRQFQPMDSMWKQFSRQFQLITVSEIVCLDNSK